MSHGKQFTLFTHKVAPNGWKVVPILEELGLTYESVYLDLSKNEQKGPRHTQYNPNGRIPTLIDHKNNDFVIWESNAIIQYLADRYDTEHKISATGNEKYQQLQWMYFQASGQGPYFGQAGWFMIYHPEKIPSAIERYKNEIKRVFSVLDGVLAKQEWLVGGKMTIADMSFIPWTEAAIQRIFENLDFGKEYPAVSTWHKKLMEVPSVKKAWTERATLSTQ